MRRQVEGSQAVAEAVARCRPQVISAYPISPQTHIVESLSRMVKAGELTGCEYINVESEFGAMSVAIGAAATGSRTYTATASQGLLYMVEAIFNAAGMELPIVMTVANRAIGAPINIWNDHSDAMSQRDCGWLQLYAADNQEAADLHVQAFRLAETLSLPVMVCMDGFVLTHAYEEVDLPEQEQVDRFLPPIRPQQVLDPDHPVTIGTMVGPEAFTEVRYLAHLRHREALTLLDEVAAEFETAFGRPGARHVRPYRCSDADTVVVALGSVQGTLADVVDERREQGDNVGSLGVTSFRPFPHMALRAALAGAERVVVLERSLSPGSIGPVTADVREALGGLPIRLFSVIGGLGGRPLTKTSLHDMVDRAERGLLEPMSFLDLDQTVVDRELGRRGAAHLAALEVVS